MTEADIAAMVAEAVARHDETTSWGQELLHNAETIVTLVIAAISGIAVIVRSLHRMDKRIQSVEEYRVSHQAEDVAAHKALSQEGEHILRELRAFRDESTRQHESLGQRVEAGMREGSEGRGKLHEKVDALTRDVHRLVGRAEAKDD